MAIDPSAASIVRELASWFCIGLLGVKARVLIFKTRAAPAIGEIEDRHVEYEHGVVPRRALSKPFAQPALKIVSK
jgi:hypothetical protein